MFERNPVDNINAVSVAVEITLDDGSGMVGRAAIDKGKSVHQLLNGEGDFLYVEGPGGEGDFIPKASIKGLRIVKPIQPRALRQPPPSDSAPDPARVLGVEAAAPWADVHAAYRRLAKMYHPDRYSSIELPPEVQAYLEDKAKQVTQAFQLMKASRNGGWR